MTEASSPGDPTGPEPELAPGMPRELVTHTLLTLARGGHLGGEATAHALDRVQRGAMEQLMESGLLPVQTQEGSDEPYVRLGFRFGPVSQDPLLREATLPGGWRRELPPMGEGAHLKTMMMYLVDDAERVRARVMFKATTGDRYARMWLDETGMPGDG